MNLFLRHILFVAVLLFAACKKEPLPSEEPGNPVFKFSGELDGIPVNFNAGDNEYYMYSSFYQDMNNIYVYKADLKQQTCVSNCSYGLTVLINDTKVSATNADMDVNRAVQVGPYVLN